MKPRSIKRLGAVCALPVLFAAGSALADARPAPEFATLDSVGTTSSFSVNAAVSFFDNEFFGDATGLNVDLHADYYFTPSVGGYLTLPISHAFVDEIDDETDLGNIDLGAMFAPRLNGPLSLVLRGGFALPTATDGGATFFTAFGDLSDYVLHFPDVTSIRMSASLFGGSGNIFWRLDGGLDVPFDSGDNATTIDLDPLIRLNAGAGVETGSVALMGELANLGTTGDVGDTSDRFIHTLGLSARFTSGSTQPIIALILPLDSDLRDFVDFTLMFGISAPMGSGAR